MPLKLAARIVVTLLFVVCGIWLGRSSQFYTEALVSIYFAATLTSVVVIHFRAIPSSQDALLVLCGTCFFATIDFQFLHYKPMLASWLSFAGLSSLLILGVRTIWAQDSRRKLLVLAFVPGLLLVASEYFATTFLGWTAAAHPKVLDLYLYSFDASLGVQLPFIVGQRFATWPSLQFASMIFYIALSIPIALIYAGRLVRLHEKAVPSFVTFIATGPVGIFFYNLFPALGPAHVFGQQFPWHPLITNQVSRLFVEPVAIQGAPNAIPSLHMAWVLLAWWYSRGLSWWERGVAFLFLTFTVLATLGSGEHYFVDLVVAVPFALFLKAVCSFGLGWNQRQRLVPILGGLFLTLGWLAALRYGTHFFWLSPLLPWTFCMGTIAFSSVLEQQLHNHLEGTGTGNAVALTTPISELAASN